MTKAKPPGRLDHPVVETVFQVGVAGGSLSIQRLQGQDGEERFVVRRNESALYDLLDDEDRRDLVEDYVPQNSFHSALQSIARYPWPEMTILIVLPAYVDTVIAEVSRLGGPQQVARWHTEMKAQPVTTPVAFATGLVEHLEHLSHSTVGDVLEAKKFLRERRDLRKEPLDRQGYEYVVEILFRPTITKYAEGALRISTSDSNRHIYSSHFHTTSDPESVWRTRWEDFKRARHVDTDDNGHARRADLFVSVGSGELVSIEFKYLRAKTKPAVQACITQIRQHLTEHRACVLVLYAAKPVSAKLESAVGVIRDELRGRNGFVVVMSGPPIEFP